jgi:cytochrome bd-type quinol oxidase subunit 2
MTDEADKAARPTTPVKVVDAADAVVTYRSLRIAMVAATALLAASILQLWVHNNRSFEGSISAYYYTVAHGVFIAAVCALGICLIAYKGHSPTEDVLLDVAGILAFVVAFVPTKGEHILDPHLPSQVDASAGVTNNIWALLIAIGLGFGAYGCYVTFAERGRAGDVNTTPTERDLLIQQTYQGYAVTAKKMVDKQPWLKVLAAFAKWSLPVAAVAIAVVGFLWFLTDPHDFTEHAHGRAAAAMFGSLTVVVAHYAGYAVVGIKTDSSRRKYAWTYLALGVVMLVTVVLAGCAYAQQPAGGVHVFAYEVVLLGAFTTFWLVQTWDLWNGDPYADTPAGDPHHTTPGADH